jgi:hypothetical protein
MRTTFLFCAILFLASIFVASCDHCEGGDTRPLSFLVQKKDGKDWINPSTKGAFVKDSIRFTDSQKQPISFAIDSLTTPVTTTKKITQFHLTPTVPLTEGESIYYVKWNHADTDTLSVKVELVSSCKLPDITKVTFNKVECSIDKVAYAWPYLIIK